MPDLLEPQLEDYLPVIDVSETEVSLLNKKVAIEDILSLASPPPSFAVDTISGFLESPGPKTYTLQMYSYTSYRVAEIRAKTVTGTCNVQLATTAKTFTFMPNPVLVDAAGFTLTSANSNLDYVYVGSTLIFTISNTADPVDLTFSIKVLKDFQPIPTPA